MEMVNLLLPLTVALLLGFSPAAGIKCYKCDGGSCTDQEDCGSNINMCMAAHTSVNGHSRHQWMGCAEPKMCSRTGLQIASMTHKVTVLTQIYCCNTELCNTQIPPTPLAPPAGSVTCFNPYNNADKHIKCNALENNCFKTVGHYSDIYGCSSPNACAAKELWQYLLALSADGYLVALKDVTCEEKAPPPPALPQCDVCLDPCCSTIVPITAHGMKCVAATVKVSSGRLTVRKAIASAPLCSLSLTKKYAIDETEVQVTCCDTDHCNTEAPEFQASLIPEPVSPCHGPGCTDGLYEQLHLLVKGWSVRTQTCSSTESDVLH